MLKRFMLSALATSLSTLSLAAFQSSTFPVYWGPSLGLANLDNIDARLRQTEAKLVDDPVEMVRG